MLDTLANAPRYLVAVGTLALWLAIPAERAEACGCFSPPVDPLNYAVNQQAEQIIFEVHDNNTVTAHVLIQYAGNPASFAWLLPVASVPQLALSETLAFALLDDLTRPQVAVASKSLCPDPEYVCDEHPHPFCEGDIATRGFADASAVDSGVAPSAESPPPSVDVIQRAVIGSYDTVVFAATDAATTVDWLISEGFIVNSTMTPFMQPYLDAGMAFVAAKLVPGAGTEEIRPLAVTYDGQQPMIPLQLTAVAAEPEMGVTAYVYGDAPYEPVDRPVIAILDEWISADAAGRSNYPMVLSRAVDEAGGDAFVHEYVGVPPVPSAPPGRCCGNGSDFCGLGGDGQCQCPTDAFDKADCNLALPGLESAQRMLSALASRNSVLTRITTRVSAHEMTFDPTYRKMPSAPSLNGRLSLNGTRPHLDECRNDVIDRGLFAQIDQRQACASVYCGTGECVVTTQGVGCACDAHSTARSFTDLDGQSSVTCVPKVPPVDLKAGGITLPDACVGVACGEGSCLDVGGFPTCVCDPNRAAALPAATTAIAGTVAPTCSVIMDRTGRAGGDDFSDGIEDVRVCAPAPPSCGPSGWLVRNDHVTTQGVICPQSVPSSARLEIPPAPTCNPLYPRWGYDEERVDGCNASPWSTAPWGSMFLFLGATLAVARRRRR